MFLAKSATLEENKRKKRKKETGMNYCTVQGFPRVCRDFFFFFFSVMYSVGRASAFNLFAIGYRAAAILVLSMTLAKVRSCHFLCSVMNGVGFL